MKKTIIMICLGMLCLYRSYGQSNKKTLDTAVIKDWPIVCDAVISNDGQYAAYYTFRGRDASLTIKNLKSNNEKIYDEAGREFKFTADSKYALLPGRQGGLKLIHLIDFSESNLPNIGTYTLFGPAQDQRLIYSQQSGSEKLIVRDIINGKEMTFDHISATNFGKTHLFLTRKEDNNYQFQILDPVSSSVKNTWTGNGPITSLVINQTDDIAAFQADGKAWYYNKIQTLTLPIPATFDNKRLSFSEISEFNKSGTLLFLNYAGAAKPGIEKNANPVQIFSYQDASFAIENGFEQRTYRFAYDINNRKLIPLERENENFQQVSDDGNYALVQLQGQGGEAYWNKKQLPQYAIKRISYEMKTTGTFNGYPIGFSPKSDLFLFGKLPGPEDYFTLDVKSGAIASLTQQLPIPLTDNPGEQLSGSSGRGLSFTGWLPDGHTFLLYDRYDLWQIDPLGKVKPVILTNGYGRKNHIQLRLLQSYTENNAKLNFKNNELIYLAANNEDTKECGYYAIRWGKQGVPEKLTMESRLYRGTRNNDEVKAKNANIWLVQRQSATESPNYFWTKDFKTFQPVSDNYPERQYNWFTTELINYTTKDGIQSQAILYKPNNLDPNKKYPVLFNFYEHETFKLNHFQHPAFTSNYYFNYPMMLSRGYLVCVPDIHFKLGQTAHNIVDCVEGAIDAIANRPYVDTARLGANGGSFGGYGVNCLTAFSRRFKALVPISGPSDLVSMYGNVPGLRDEEVENRQMRMGISLSRDPEQYLHNSPVAYAKDVSTPLLIVNTLEDGNVNVQQGIEWFISLRREGKPAWMLRYRGNAVSHGISNMNDQKDLYARMNQFFDHYLKGAPAPKWMTDSLPVWERSGEAGFKLMPPGIEPGPGLNTEEDLKRKAEYLTPRQ